LPGNLPKEVVIEDKTTARRRGQKTIFKLIDKMLTNKKFKDFFNKNVAAL
jgi:hypothetical protein